MLRLALQPFQETKYDVITSTLVCGSLELFLKLPWNGQQCIGALLLAPSRMGSVQWMCGRYSSSLPRTDLLFYSLSKNRLGMLGLAVQIS
jgi:hypothetical protein